VARKAAGFASGFYGCIVRDLLGVGGHRKAQHQRTGQAVKN
jgi:hypothetical protein